MAVPPTRTERLMVQVGDDEALICSVRELGQQAARIMSQVEETREPAFYH